MDHSVQVVMSLLINYWQGFGVLDVQTKNYCRRLTETIKKKLPATKATLILQESNQNIEELIQILDQLFRADPNSRQLINILAETANRSSPRAQSVNISGSNNQVVTVGKNMIGDPTIQNSIDLFSKNMIDQEKTINSAPEGSDLAGNKYENKVFVSYAWGGDSERIVDALQQALGDQGIEMIRDKQHLAYKGSIEEFEQRIGRGKCIVLVISDKYLRSKHCMYEFVKIWGNHNLRERIFPIVLPDVLIFDLNERLEYINYWDEQIEHLNKSIKNVKIVANLTETGDLDKLVQIRQHFSHLINLVSDMNLLTPAILAAHGFSIIISEIKSFMEKSG
jgi:hypothetical protein